MSAPNLLEASLSVGDIIRIKNRNGIGGVEASSAYFELNILKAIDATGITLENKLVHTFTDYCIMKYTTNNGFSVSGGKIKFLYMRTLRERSAIIGVLFVARVPLQPAAKLVFSIQNCL
jgi:hypothetical protein